MTCPASGSFGSFGCYDQLEELFGIAKELVGSLGIQAEGTRRKLRRDGGPRYG
jgi:hypothetical protein